MVCIPDYIIRNATTNLSLFRVPYNASADCWNMPLALTPMAVTARIQTIAIRDSIRAYSTIVAPSSSLKKLIIFLNIFFSFFAMF